MSKQYLYIRTSTKKQDLARQEELIKLYPDATVIAEKASGKSVEGRTEFQRLLKLVKTGDTIVFDSVSRMSRNATEGAELYEQMYRDGVELVFVHEPQVNTECYRKVLESQIRVSISSGNAAMDICVKKMIDALNEFAVAMAKVQFLQAFQQAETERLHIVSSVKQGLECARAAGKQIGQVQGAKLHIKKKDELKALIRKEHVDFGGRYTTAEFLRIHAPEYKNGKANHEHGISKNTFYKYLQELKAEQEQK